MIHLGTKNLFAFYVNSVSKASATVSLFMQHQFKIFILKLTIIYFFQIYLIKLVTRRYYL